MDRFEEAEREGRQVIFDVIKNKVDEHWFTPQKFCNVDLFLTGKTGTEVVMEIKHRSGYTSQDITRMGGTILEYPKYTALTSYDEYKPIYTVIYADEILMWDVSKINTDRFIEVDNKYHQKTMSDTPIIPKKLAYLDRNEACTIIKRKK